MIVHKSRKKAVCITVAGFLAGIAGGLILYCVRDVVLGWCFVATAGFTLLYGIGSLYDRRAYIVLTEDGITEMFTIRGQIEWEAILYADDFYFRGQYWVRLLLESNYKPAAHTAGLVLAVRPPLRIEGRKGGLSAHDGAGDRFHAAGRPDPADEGSGCAREDRAAERLPVEIKSAAGALRPGIPSAAVGRAYRPCLSRGKDSVRPHGMGGQAGDLLSVIV